jgi:hypothetical protein
MISSGITVVTACALTASMCCGAVCEDTTAPEHQASPIALSRSVSESRIDPLAFFEQLVLRYRNLSVYSDQTRITKTTRRLSEGTTQTTQTQVVCDVANGELRILTPSDQLRRSLRLNLPVQSSEALEQAKASYDLWLLPHMTLKFAEKPLEEFREGVKEGFTATEAAQITIDDKPMVHLELTSGDGLSGDYTARYDLYVDPDSMLIERIEGRQRMPDGDDFETRYDIMPTYVEDTKPYVPVEQDEESTDAVTTPHQPNSTPTITPRPCDAQGTEQPPTTPKQQGACVSPPKIG